MADEHIDIREQANGAGIAAGLVCGLVGYGVNGIGGAFAAAIAAYGAMRILVFMLHTLKAFIISGIILMIGAAMLAGYVGRAGKAMSKDETVVPAPVSVPEASPEIAVPEVNTEEESPTAGKLISFKNDCPRAVALYLRWDRPGFGWTVNGRWNIEGNKQTFLNVVDGGENIRSASSDVYYYALIPGGDYEWSGTTNIAYDGETYRMRQGKMVETPTSYELMVNCPNL